MKKLFVLGLTCLYLVLSFGFTRYEHVCKSENVRAFSSAVRSLIHADKPCPICQEREKGLTEKKKGCCQFETKLVKLDEGIKKHSSIEQTVKFWGTAIPNQTLGAVFESLFFAHAVQIPFNLSSKIPLGSNPLYILNCVYRI